MRIDGLTHDDYSNILEDLHSFWGSDRTRHLHHPMFVREFSDSAFATRDGRILVGYLMGMRSQTEPVGYIHLAAVRDTYRGRGVAQGLYRQFALSSRAHGITDVRAITTEMNRPSISFHQALGFHTQLIPDYAGPRQDRVLMHCPVDTLTG